MPFTDSEIRALKAGEKMKDFSAGPGLRIRLEPAKKGGGKSFYGYMYFPTGGGGKKVEGLGLHRSLWQGTRKVDPERRQGRVGPHPHLVPRDGQGPQRTEEGGACGRRGAAEDANA